VKKRRANNIEWVEEGQKADDKEGTTSVNPLMRRRFFLFLTERNREEVF
jgi:hypothetical protein